MKDHRQVREVQPRPIRLETLRPFANSEKQLSAREKAKRAQPLTSAQNAGTDCSQAAVSGKTKYWGDSYGYDAWGNMLQKTPTKCSAENLNVQARSNNQLVVMAMIQPGNMTHEATGGNYSYDAQQSKPKEGSCSHRGYC